LGARAKFSFGVAFVSLINTQIAVSFFDVDVYTYKCHPEVVEAAIAGFDWDDGNRSKCHKHGVSAEEVESLFLG
jgi:hypothetical protein